MGDIEERNMAASTASKAAFSADTDIHITLEDQQKINRFARQNARYEELKDDLKVKKRDLQNLEDASDDLLMVEDESAPVPFVIGEVFAHLGLEEAKTQVDKDIAKIEADCAKIKEVMLDLKTQLYAKFGNSINLEAEDE